MIHYWKVKVKLNAGLIIWQAAGIAMAAALFISCSKEHDIPDPPEIQFLRGEYTPENLKRVSNDTILYQGAKFVFGVHVVSRSEKNLSKIIVTRKYESSASKKVLDTIMNSNTFTYDFVVNASTQDPGMEVFEIIARDINNNSTSASFTITTIFADPGINRYKDVYLGSFQSEIYDNGFASATGETFDLTDTLVFVSESKHIDWVYFRSETYGHTFMAPANNISEIWYPQIKDWTKRKTTLFAKTNLNASAFNSINNDQVLKQTIQNLNLNLSKDFYSEKVSIPGGIAENLIIAFKSEENQYGLILVKEFSTGINIGASYILIDVKVVK